MPPLPAALRRAARDVLTAEQARHIILARGGRLATVAEKRRLAAAGLEGLPSE